MGFESFRVELHGGSGNYREADEIVRRLPHIKPDTDSLPLPGSTFYVIDDEQHVIELELMNSPVRLSCRFTLCHSPSIDSVFMNLVRDLMTRLEREVKICDDVPPDHAHSFTLDDFDECSAVVSRCITLRRAEWVAACGGETLAASMNEVYQRIILPQCQPGVEQPA